MNSFLEVPLFCVSAAVLVYGAMMATRSLKDISYFHWISASLALFYVGILLVQQAFGFAGEINSAMRYICFLLLGFLLVRYAPSDKFAHSLESTNERKVDWRAVAMAVSLPALCILFNGLKAGLLIPPVDIDSVVYHLPIPVRMLQTGSVTNTEGEYWFFPSHSELIVHWLIKPLHSDALASLQNLIPAVMLICSVAGFIWSFTRSNSLAIGMSLCMWVYFFHVRRQFYSQENDLFVAAFWLVALQMLLVWLDTRKLVHLLLSAAAVGVVLGTKYSGVYYVGAYGLLLACGLFDQGRFRVVDYLRASAVVALVVLLVGSGWYIRNWLVVGSPMYPKDFGIFTVADGADGLTKNNTGIQSTVFYHMNSLETYRLLFVALYGFGGLLGFVSAILLPATMFMTLRRNKQFRYFWVAATLLSLLAPLISPISAETIPGTLNMLKFGGAPMRYGLSFLALSVVMAATAIHHIRQIQGDFPADGIIGIVLASLPIARELNYPGGSCLLAIVTLVVIAILYFVYSTRRLYFHWPKVLDSPRYVIPMVSVGAISFGLALAWAEPKLQSIRIAKRNEVYLGMYGQANDKETQLFAWCDQHLMHSSVGLTGPLVHPFFGPELSNRSQIAKFSEILQPAADDSQLPKYIVVTRIFGEPEFDPNSGTFPSQKAQLDRQPERFRVVFEDEFATVYEVVEKDSGAKPKTL